MIILNSTTLLVLEDEVEDNIEYVHGYIVYAEDSYRFDIGRIIKNQGNFLYDKNYVYRWRIDKEYPSVYNIKERREEISKETAVQLMKHYKSFI